MKLYAITDSLDDKFAGAYTNPKLAKIVLEIFQLVVDEGSEMITVDSDLWGKELLAGLKPWEISVEYNMRTNKIIETDVHAIWPPGDEEGVVENREGFRRYFFWAKTKGEAITKLATVRIPANTELMRMRERLSEQEPGDGVEEEEDAYS